MTATLASKQPTAPASRKFLTFKVAGTSYGVDILKVQEIIGLPPVTPLPDAPDSFLGLIDLRGMVMPALDLSHKFGHGPGTLTASTCVVVVQARRGRLGLVVDEVQAVRDVQRQDVTPPPDLGDSPTAPYVWAIAHGTKGRLRPLLDVDALLAPSEAALVETPDTTPGTTPGTTPEAINTATTPPQAGTPGDEPDVDTDLATQPEAGD